MVTAAQTPPSSLVQRHLDHLRVQRRLADRTLAMYLDAFTRLDAFCAREGLALASVKPHHVRGWTARLHAGGLGPRSIAITLSAWRGLFRWMGREGLATLNPVEGVRAPKGAKPLPKALSVEQAVALSTEAPPRPPPPRSRDAREAGHCAGGKRDGMMPRLQG